VSQATFDRDKHCGVMIAKAFPIAMSLSALATTIFALVTCS
jgi:hypothetical protein